MLAASGVVIRKTPRKDLSEKMQHSCKYFAFVGFCSYIGVFVSDPCRDKRGRVFNRSITS